ncbi:ComEC/Rec2 family competence protein [Candidatus Saccharibacteria bacterium]|nr:ComEC/Rec2 family competence protein [Candidatus Saccharibacteria bacterium]
MWTVPILCLAAGCTGLGYGVAHLGERAPFRSLIGATSTVEGRVREDPSISASGSVSLQLDTLVVEDVDMSGAPLVSVRGAADVKRGDIVVARGVLEESLGSFVASMRVPSLDEVRRPVPGDVGRVVRDWFADEVRSAIADPQASLGIGFLTGQKSALPNDVAEALKIAGLTHIVVASGYNLTILVRLARRLFLRFSRYLSTVSSSFMIMAFMAVTGLSPSMVRAGLVSSLSVLSWYYGRALHPFVLLPLAAAITVAFQPSYVWGDLGWQLSFAAFIGVMVVAPLFQRYFFGDSEPGVFRQILGETLAAHAVTVPIIALSFGTTSHVAIIANLLVVPLVPLAMLLTFLSGILAIVQAPFAFIIATPTEWLLAYMLNVAQYVAGLSWAQTEASAEAWLWVGYGVALAAACFWMWRVTRYRFQGEQRIY